MVEEFRARRDLIVDGLNAIPGITCLQPGRRVLRVPGHLRHGLTGRSSPTGCSTRRGVCVLSGTAFGEVGADHLRVSYANSRENIAMRWTGSRAPSPTRAPGASRLPPAERD